MELLWIVISNSAKIRITASFCSETPLLFTFSAIKMLKIDICYLFITWKTDKALKVCCALIKFQARNPNEHLGKTFFLRSLFFSLQSRVLSSLFDLALVDLIDLVWNSCTQVVCFCVWNCPAFDFTWTHFQYGIYSRPQFCSTIF